MKNIIVATAALLASTSVYAQTTPSNQIGNDNAQNSVAQSSDTDTQPLEIIVTAQKREQSLQDVSASITAVTSDRLTEAHVNNLQDLQSVVPSVDFGSDFNQAKIFIRGVGANTSTTGGSTGVAFHIDGAYVARAEAQLTSLFDMKRVEVLRGPQGTLYGRNAVGGSINIISNKPTDYLDGYARLSYGNYNALVSEFAIGGPITNGITARLATKTENRDGFGTNPVTGKGIDNLNRRMGRLQLDFDLGHGADLLLSGEYFRQADASGALHYLRDSFPGVARLASLGAGGYATNPRDVATESDPGTDTKTYAFTGTLHVPLNDQVTITDIANYRNFKSALHQDLDTSAVVESLATNGQSTTIHGRLIDSKQWSNEFRLGYDDGGYINGVVGAYFFHERQRPRDTVGLADNNGMAQNIPILEAAGVNLDQAYELCGYSPDTVTGGSTVIAPKRVCTHSNLGTTAYALFGQANIGLGAFSDALANLSIKLGGRFSHEHVTSENPAIIIARGGLGPVIQFTAAGTHVEKTFKDFTPEAGLEWRPTSHVMLYYTYSQGFQAGSAENAAGSTTIVDPETITNHEAGIKATISRKLTVNLSVYSYKLDGLQLNKTIAGGPTGYTTIFQNAATTRAKGFELEVNTRPLRHLRVDGALSYTDAHFSDYVTLDPLNPANISTPGDAPYNAVTNPDPTAFGAPSGGDIQLAGNDTRNTPRWSGNIHGAYDIPAPRLGGIFTLSGNLSYKGKTYFTEYQRDIQSARAYTKVDGSIGYETDDRKIKASVWIQNAFNVFRPSSTFALATARLIGVVYLPPRTYGATIGYSF